MKTTQEIIKEGEYTDKILDIIEAQVRSLEYNDGLEYTQSDLQGAVQAVIMNAIQYGKDNK